MPIEEKEVRKLQEETKKLLDKFSLALNKIKSKKEWNVLREEDRRKEGNGKHCDEEFRKILLENAPQYNESFIIAEKKSW